MANTDHFEVWLVSIERSFQGLSVAVETVRILEELVEIWPNEVCDIFLLPHNVYTAITTLSIQSQITYYICCPKCFYHYSLGELAKFCTWYKTPWSRPYGEKLWTLWSTCSSSKLVPWWLYNMQVFSSWFETFLFCSGIKDLIDQYYGH